MPRKESISMITIKQGDGHAKGNDQVIRSFTNAIKRISLVSLVKGKQHFKQKPNRAQRRKASVLRAKKKQEFEYMEKTGKLARMKAYKGKNRPQQRSS